jgi:outer membrane protein OmpA-like peptidoglycan-associated protein
MYIWTREGLGQGQPIWSTLQTFNRPTGQPTPTGYLGNFNEHMGKAESKPCKEIWAVWGFKPSSSELLDFQKQHIKDIATRIVSLLQGDLKRKGSDRVRLRIVYEGHVDKKTDPAQYGELDAERASEVASELREQILKKWDKRLSLLLSIPELSGAGSTRPFGSGSDPQKNRRVVICLRWEIESPQKQP